MKNESDASERIECGEGSVAVLLASYNGEKYIAEQLDSLLKQTILKLSEGKRLKIFIHDDGSSDKTAEILERFRREHPDLIHIIEGAPTGGAGNNFFYLMKKVHAQYYLFCDQDDVWLTEKIETELKAIKELEESVKEKSELFVKEEGVLGCKVPCLAWCDMKVVNEKLEVMDDSIANYLKSEPYNLRLYRCLNGGKASGCGIITNDSNVKLFLHMKTYVMDSFFWHDFSLFNIARMAGALRYIDKPLSLYRQHAGNVFGAGRRKTKVFVVFSLIKRLIKGEQVAHTKAMLFIAIRFIASLKAIEPIYEKYVKMIDGAESFEKMGRLAKVRYIKKYKLYAHTFLAGRLWTYFAAFLIKRG